MTSPRRSHLTRAVVGLTAAAAPTAGGIALLNHYHWEETAAKLDLVVVCAAAALLGGVAGTLFDRRISRALAWALAAAALVFPLLFLYFIVLMWTISDYS